jgi:hypothetical protein
MQTLLHAAMGRLLDLIEDYLNTAQPEPRE